MVQHAVIHIDLYEVTHEELGHLANYLHEQVLDDQPGPRLKELLNRVAQACEQWEEYD